jgi:hypothetical protein
VAPGGLLTITVSWLHAARQKPFVKRRSFVAIYIPVTTETNSAISRRGIGSIRVARKGSRIPLEALSFCGSLNKFILKLGHSLGADLTRLRDRRIRIWVRGVAIQTRRTNELKREEEVMKADALMHFILSGNRSLEEFAVLLARISMGLFSSISGENKLFVASQYNPMYETITEFELHHRQEKIK